MKYLSYVWFTYWVSVYRVYARCPSKSEEGMSQISWDWSQRWLLTTMRVLGAILDPRLLTDKLS